MKIIQPQLETQEIPSASKDKENKQQSECIIHKQSKKAAVLSNRDFETVQQKFNHKRFLIYQKMKKSS